MSLTFCTPSALKSRRPGVPSTSAKRDVPGACDDTSQEHCLGNFQPHSCLIAPVPLLCIQLQHLPCDQCYLFQPRQLPNKQCLSVLTLPLNLPDTLPGVLGLGGGLLTGVPGLLPDACDCDANSTSLGGGGLPRRLLADGPAGGRGEWTAPALCAP